MSSNSSTVVLLDDNDKPTKQFETVLNIIFSRFDKDKDGVLSLKELQDFAKFTNGSEFFEEELEEIQDNLECDDKDQLTKDGFHQMYWLQTVGDEEETWKDLEKHGFDKSLKLAKKPETVATKDDDKASKTENTGGKSNK